VSIIRDILERAFDAHAHACLDDEVDRARLIDAIECELQSHPAALLVREALGPDPIARVVRVAGANGRLQARLHDASYALAGGEETMTTPKKKPSRSPAELSHQRAVVESNHAHAVLEATLLPEPNP
jgi:hypothetical protein